MSEHGTSDVILELFDKVFFSLFAWIWYISKISMVVLSALPKIYRNLSFALSTYLRSILERFPLLVQNMLPGRLLIKQCELLIFEAYHLKIADWRYY